MSTHVNGQIWIDKNSPYKLKYRVNGIDYVVETSATYYIDPNTLTDIDIEGCYLHSGEVVALNESGNIIRAEFPKHIKNVLGVVLADVTENNKDAGVGVIQTGYLELLHPNAPFSEKFSENIEAGTPVYWDLTNGGKLTLKTPSDSVKYSNLPQIGTVAADYTTSSEDSLYLHINVPSFDSTMEWYAEVSTDEVKDSTIEINHNLFKGSISQCHVDIVFVDKDNEYPALAHVSHTTESTKINVSNPYAGTYKITGRVSYSI